MQKPKRDPDIVNILRKNVDDAEYAYHYVQSTQPDYDNDCDWAADLDRAEWDIELAEGKLDAYLAETEE